MANASRLLTPAPDIFNRGSGMTEGGDDEKEHGDSGICPPPSFRVDNVQRQEERAGAESIRKMLLVEAEKKTMQQKDGFPITNVGNDGEGQKLHG